MMFTLLNNAALFIADWKMLLNYLAIVLNIPTENGHRSTTKGRCGTEAPWLLDNGNPQANLCVDPYNFVCAQFKEKRGLEARRASFPVVDMEETVLKFLESEEESCSEAISFAKELHKSCIINRDNSRKAILDLWEMKQRDDIDWPLVDQKSMYSGLGRIDLPHYVKEARIIQNLKIFCQSHFNREKCNLHKQIFSLTVSETATKVSKIVGVQLNIEKLKEDVKCLLFLHSVENPTDKPEFATNCKIDSDSINAITMNNKWLNYFEWLRQFAGNDFLAHIDSGRGTIQVSERLESSRVCYEAIIVMADAHDAIYTRKMEDTDKNIKRRVDYARQLVADTKAEMIAYVYEKWSDPLIRQKVEKDFADLKVEVGYDDKSLDDPSLDAYYREILDNRHDNFFVQLTKIVKFHNTNGPVLNQRLMAVYNYLTHAISIPLSTFYEPYYAPDQTESVNMGRIGLMIAHEFTHALNASLVALNVISSDTFQTYRSCLTSAYDKFLITADVSVNGTFTLEENIADYIGHRVSLRTLKRRTKSFNEADFLLASLWFFCESPIAIDAQVMISRTDVHTPNPYRIRGIMNQSPIFHKVFGCEKKDEYCEIFNT